MKKLLLLLFCFIHSISNAQIENEEDAKKFWADNILAIIELDKVKILSQTIFPLEINSGKSFWKKEDFSKRMTTLFSDEVRLELKNGSFKNIDAWTMADDTSQTYMVISLVPYENYDAVVFLFRQINTDWKLVGIDFQIE